MEREERKQTNIEVNVVDLSRILSEKKIEGWNILKVTNEFGFVETKRGTYFLSNEGYGDNQPMGEKQVKIEVHGENSKSFSMVPVAILKMTIDELKQLPIIKVPLHNFIRRFGSRLEGNYKEWCEALEEAST